MLRIFHRHRTGSTRTETPCRACTRTARVPTNGDRKLFQSILVRARNESRAFRRSTARATYGFPRRHSFRDRWHRRVAGPSSLGYGNGNANLRLIRNG